MKRTLGLLGVILLASCSGKDDLTARHPAGASAKEEKVLNLHIWSEYFHPDTIARFEKETGIQVSETNYASNEELDGKLAAGSSGYDVVVPSASFYARQIRSGYYRRLDKSLLPNLPHMDPEIQQRLTVYDPNNDYAMPYMWGTTGIGYNVKKVKAAAPDAPLDSWQMVFDPVFARKFHKCGIGVLESNRHMFTLALHAIGRDPNSQDPADIEAAAAALMRMRPYIRYIDTQRMTTDLANGEICVAVDYIGDIVMGRDRVKENRTGVQIGYFIPKEGSVMWLDGFLIPKDAPHPANAHAFINYMMRPEVIGPVTNTVKSASSNQDATPFVDKALLEDPAIYPPPEVRSKLILELPDTEATTRLKTRLWTRFMTGS